MNPQKAQVAQIYPPLAAKEGAPAFISVYRCLEKRAMAQQEE